MVFKKKKFFSYDEMTSLAERMVIRAPISFSSYQWPAIVSF